MSFELDLLCQNRNLFYSSTEPNAIGRLIEILGTFCGHRPLDLRSKAPQPGRSLKLILSTFWRLP